ncbi:hypothetical protein LIER_29621 [Lithospermum erythrorhizon]|uniref:Uncharacterized protein n=1 Tax=Lithospermum erythrorhizon TaxID=34254 RepID=A0AAV3RQP3_LITER
MSMAGICPGQLTPNCTLKDVFLYIGGEIEDGRFPCAFSSKVDPETWRPYIFFVSGKGLSPGIPSRFTSQPKSKAGLSPGFDVDLGDLEALRATFMCMTLPLLAPTSVRSVVVSSSSKEDEVVSPLLRRIRHPVGESPVLGPSEAALEPLGAGNNTSPGSRGNLSASPWAKGSWGGRLSESFCCHFNFSSRLGAASYEAVPISTGRTPDPHEEGGTPLANPWPVQSQRRSEKAPLPQSLISPASDSMVSKRPPAGLSQEELISSFSALGDKVRPPRLPLTPTAFFSNHPHFAVL